MELNLPDETFVAIALGGIVLSFLVDRLLRAISQSSEEEPWPGWIGQIPVYILLFTVGLKFVAFILGDFLFILVVAVPLVLLDGVDHLWNRITGRTKPGEEDEWTRSIAELRSWGTAAREWLRNRSGRAAPLVPDPISEEREPEASLPLFGRPGAPVRDRPRNRSRSQKRKRKR